MKIKLSKMQVFILVVAILELTIAAAYICAGFSNGANGDDILPQWVTFSLVDGLVNWLILLTWVALTMPGPGQGPGGKRQRVGHISRFSFSTRASR